MHLQSSIKQRNSSTMVINDERWLLQILTPLAHARTSGSHDKAINAPNPPQTKISQAMVSSCITFNEISAKLDNTAVVCMAKPNKDPISKDKIGGVKIRPKPPPILAVVNLTQKVLALYFSHS